MAVDGLASQAYHIVHLALVDVLRMRAMIAIAPRNKCDVRYTCIWYQRWIVQICMIYFGEYDTPCVCI